MTAFINGGDSPIWLWWWWISSERICTPIGLCAFFLKARIAFSFSLLNTPQWKCWQRGANMFSWGLPCVPAAEMFWETVIPAKAAGSWPSAYCAVQGRTKWNVQYIGQWHVSSSLSAFNPSAFKGFRNNKRMMWLPNLHDSLLIAGNLYKPHNPQLLSFAGKPIDSSRYHPCRSLRLFEQRHEMAWR